MGRKRKGCVKQSDEPEKAIKVNRKGGKIVKPVLDDIQQSTPVSLEDESIKRQRNGTGMGAPSYQYALDDIMSSQSDGTGEVGWEWRPIGGEMSSHNTDITELVKAFSVGERTEDAIPCTPPVLRGWLESPSGEQPASATTNTATAKARPRVKRGRRGEATGAASECRQLLQKLAVLYEQQEKETEISEDDISTKRSRLNNEERQHEDAESGSPLQSLDTSTDLFEPTQRNTSATSTQALPASLPDFAYLSPIGPKQKSHLMNSESPVNDSCSSPVIQKTLLSTPISSHKRVLSIRHTPRSARGHTAAHQQSFEELWTDEELFENDSFLTMTQTIASNCGLKSPSPVNAQNQNSDKQKVSVIESVGVDQAFSKDGVITTGLISKTKCATPAACDAVFKLPAPVRVTPDKGKLSINQSAFPGLTNKKAAENTPSSAQSKGSKFNFSKRERSTGACTRSVSYSNASSIKTIENKSQVLKPHDQVKIAGNVASKLAPVTVSKEKNKNVMKPIAKTSLIKPVTNCTLDTSKSAKSKSSVSSKTFIRQSRSLRSPTKPSKSAKLNPVLKSAMVKSESEGSSTKEIRTMTVHTADCDISLSEELLSALAEPDDLLDNSDSFSDDMKNHFIKGPNESTKKEKENLNTSLGVHALSTSVSSVPVTTQELLDFGGEDDDSLVGDLMATQQLFAMLDAVETTQLKAEEKELQNHTSGIIQLKTDAKSLKQKQIKTKENAYPVSTSSDTDRYSHRPNKTNIQPRESEQFTYKSALVHSCFDSKTYEKSQKVANYQKTNTRVLQKYPSFDSLDMQASPKTVVDQQVSASQDSPNRKAQRRCSLEQIERKRIEALQKRKSRLKLNKRK